MQYMYRIFISAFIILSFCFPYYFGKNKVHYKVYDWKVLKTPHFDIYYDKSISNVAKYAAKIAEEASSRHSQLFSYELNSIIPIIIFNNVHDFANNNIIPQMIGEGTGGFTEIFRTRVVVPFTGAYDTFHHVLKPCVEGLLT